MTTRRRLAALLAVSYGLRVWLACRGGQLFWPDEGRYLSADEAVNHLAHGRWMAAMVDLFGHVDHVLFRAAGLPAAAMELALGGAHPVLVACYFSLFSVGILYLIWAVSLRSGACEAEALWAAFLASASGSLFYYSRHFFPYDISLFLILLALWSGMGRVSPWRSVLVGSIVGLGFLVYNGYWLVGGAVLVLHTLFGPAGFWRKAGRALAASVGLFASLATVVGMGAWASGIKIAMYASFAGTVSQGDYRVGYRVIPEYLWQAEHGLLVLLILGCAIGLARAIRDPASRRVLGWWVGILFVYGGLVLLSDVVPKLVVYGRLSRTLVPFLCLGAAAGMGAIVDALGKRARGWVVYGLAALITFLAAVNFRVPLGQFFPRDFRPLARRAMSAEARGIYAFHRVLFCGSLWGARLDPDLPPHETLLRRAHPMQYGPYQFEGFSAAQRRAMNSHDISMRLIEAGPSLGELDPKWAGYPGPVRMKLRFTSRLFGLSEPLVATGDMGAADIVFVRYVDPQHAVFGLSRVGGGDIVSDPIELDYGQPHEVVVSMGSLLPPAGSTLYSLDPGLSDLRECVVVIVDKQLVLSKRVTFHPANRSTIEFGTNTLFFAQLEDNFTGLVEAFEQVPAGLIERQVPTTAAPVIAAERDREWEGSVGPLRLRLKLPAPAEGAGLAQPIVSVGDGSQSQLLYIKREGAGMARIGFETASGVSLLSEPVPLSASGVEELDVCLAALLPGPHAHVYARHPEFARMRGEVYARFNHEPALEKPLAMEPGTARKITLGANLIGSARVSPFFEGQVLSIEPLSPSNIPAFGAILADLLGSRAADWQGYTGPVTVTLIPSPSPDGSEEPLLAEGIAGSSDFLSLVHEGGGQVRVRYRREGGPDETSSPVAMKTGTRQEITISTPALMPPEGSRLYTDNPAYGVLRHLVEVQINGHSCLLLEEEGVRAAPTQIWLGSNSFHLPQSSALLSGTLRSVRRAQVQDCLAARRIDPGLSRPGWGGYPGPISMKVIFPAWTPGNGQPLITTGRVGEGDFLFVGYGPDNRAQVGQDHWGSPVALSALFDLEPGKVHTMTISFGALYPPSGSAAAAIDPRIQALRQRVIVLLDGRRLFSAEQASHPTTPGEITLGANFLGGSTARVLFGGTISDVRPAPLEGLLP